MLDLSTLKVGSKSEIIAIEINSTVISLRKDEAAFIKVLEKK